MTDLRAECPEPACNRPGSCEDRAKALWAFREWLARHQIPVPSCLSGRSRATSLMAKKLYASVGIHRPKSLKDEEVLLASMREFGEAQKRYKGLVVTAAVKDQGVGILIGLSVWSSKGEFEAAWKELSVTQPERRKEQGFRFEDHEAGPHKFYSGEEPD